MRRLLSVVIVVAATAVHLGCVSRMPERCASFFSMPGNERDKVFPTYPLEDQLVIYRCGMNRRPPDTYLAGDIADRGEPAIPLLLAKLEQDPDELTQFSIVEVFERMAAKGYLRGKPDVVSRIRRVVNRMHTPAFKDMASKSLERISQSST